MRFIPTLPVSLVVVAALLSPAVLASSAAQTAPSHKHYDEPANAPAPTPGAPLAPRLQNLGVHTFLVSTQNERAQLFMNQGLNLTYGFNHAEAARAFAEAARLDPSLAMAYWGQALVLGPNINAAMTPDAEPKALALVQKAVALKANATPRERAYIDALVLRYTGKAENRASADRAYAEAMRQVTVAFPDDLDARTLYAEALMDLRPWGYYTRDGQPFDETRLVQSSLESVIARHQTHPGALHLWIHLWESVDPKRAEAEADRLVPLMPGAGHMVHMPAHIYQRVGRHADVIRVNLLAARADEDYIAQCRAQGLYPLAYYPHNLHFIWMGATASGRKTLALESARKLAAAVPAQALASTPILQGFLAVPYLALVRFSEWDQILADKGPSYDTPYMRSVWKYARAMALIARDRLADAERELADVRALIADPSLKGQTTFSSNSGFAVMRIAPEVIAGEIAAKRRDWDRAVVHLERAVRFEDALVYTEPPDWHVPARQNLAAALLAAGRADEAETVLWEDLKRNPEHGWTLALLAKALRAQNKNDEAALVDARFAKAWHEADAAVTSAAPESEMVSFTTPAPSAPAVARDRVTLSNGVTLHYAHQGPRTGPALVLLHGYSDSWFSWSRILPLLPADLRVIAPDFRGHGDSDRPANGYRMTDLADDQDAIFSVEEHIATARQYPRGELEMVDGIGHVLHWEQPETFVSARLRFGV